MTGHNTAAVATVYSATVVASGGAITGDIVESGALSEVFNQLMAVYAIMGFFGGIALGLFTEGMPWRGVLSRGARGMFLAAGLGGATPSLLNLIFGLDIDVGIASNAQILAGYAFIVGFGQNIIVDWITERLSKKKGSGDADS